MNPLTRMNGPTPPLAQDTPTLDNAGLKFVTKRVQHGGSAVGVLFLDMRATFQDAVSSLTVDSDLFGAGPQRVQ